MPYCPAAGRDQWLPGTVDVGARDHFLCILRPVHVQPVACDDPDFVRSTGASPRLELTGGTRCLLARLAERADRSTYAAYDRAAVPALPRRAVASRGTAAFARRPRARATTRRRCSLKMTSWRPSDPRFPSAPTMPSASGTAAPGVAAGLFVHGPRANAALPLPRASILPRGSPRAPVKRVEAWTARYGDLRRALALPVALTKDGDPAPLVELPVHIEDDALRVGSPEAPCPPATTGSWSAEDEAAARVVCASQGTFRYDGRTLARVRAPSRR